MFRRFRKTIASDGRLSLEALFNRVYERLTVDEREQFLLKTMDFLKTLDDVGEDEVASRLTTFQDLVREFLSPAELALLPQNNEQQQIRCSACDGIRFILTGGHRTCQTCGSNEREFDNSPAAVSYNDEIPRINSCVYRRSNHLHMHLAQLQGRQNVNVPEHVIRAVTDEAKIQRIALPDLTSTQLRHILRKRDCAKYYDALPSILNQVSNKRPFSIPHAVEARLKQMFDDIQAPFAKAVEQICPTRKNFLNYKYTLRKCAELLDLDDLAHHFPYLKSREKMLAQDQIWKFICDELGWQYIASV